MYLASRFRRAAFAYRSFLFAVAFLGCSAAVQADPILIEITGGFITVTPEPFVQLEGEFDMRGRDFDLRGSGAAVSGASCEPCPAGSLVSTTAAVFPHFGTFTYQGVRYEFDLFTGGGGELSMSSPGLFTLPENATDLVTFRSPFVLDPSSFIMSLELPELPAVRLGLTGAGEATLALRPEPSGSGGSTNYFLESLRFDFTTPEPIPEPATILLVGGGIAALWLRRRSV
jgi:hypothetical protein